MKCVNQIGYLTLGWYGIMLCHGCTQPVTLFTLLHSSQTGLNFENNISSDDSINIINYLYYYNGGGVAAGDINNDGLSDLFLTSNQGPEALFVNLGSLQFDDISESAGIQGEIGLQKWTTGATMVDINMDGWLDIYVCEVDSHLGLQGQNRLYVNQGNNTFKNEAEKYGLDISSYSQQATFFDFDVDGDLDLFLLNHAVHTPKSYRPISSRLERDFMAGDRLFENKDGFFTDISEQAGTYGAAMGYGLAVEVADLNNDFYPDLYVTNDFHENDYLYLNQKDGTFLEIMDSVMGHTSTFSMGVDIADFNNDGWKDIVTLDMRPPDEPTYKQSSGSDSYEVFQYKQNFGYAPQYSRNMLQFNRGVLPGYSWPLFSEIGQIAGIAQTDWSWSAIIADLDNDGLKDLYVTNGIPRRPNDLDYINFTQNEASRDSLGTNEEIQLMPVGIATNHVFKNKGESFHDLTSSWGLTFKGCTNGAVVMDLDLDGDLDIVQNNLNAPAQIFENTSSRINFRSLQVILHGKSKNPNGIGATIKLYSGNTIQILENHLAQGWLSSVHSNRLQFSLREKMIADSLVVIWSDLTTNTINHPSIPGSIDVDQRFARPLPSLVEINERTFFSDVMATSGIDFKHQESTTEDFLNEELLPHSLSHDGPKISVGDINTDGLDDFFIGGAKGQSGALYLQQKGNYPFKKCSDQAFTGHWMYEDVASTFFDADQDGDLDLYVVSGGGEKAGGTGLEDRLYLNDGRGTLRHKPHALPIRQMNGSCVVAFDANEDNKLDLFIGCRSIPGSYGLPGRSQFLLNQGDGTFKDITEHMLENQGHLGMVTSALWIESRKELIIAGEWMPIYYYSFRDGKVKRNRIKHSNGWWKNLHAADLDNDGQQEIIAGNLGLNHRLSASVSEPLELYVKDFDGDLNIDPIMAHTQNGEKWLYPNLDELAAQMYLVRKEYRTYQDFSRRTFHQIFPREQLAQSYQSSIETLTSTVFIVQDTEYIAQELPLICQLAPIFGCVTADFDGDKMTELITAGNFHENHPRMGRMDASVGTWHGVRTFSDLPELPLNELGIDLSGPIRDLKMLRGPNGMEWLLVSANNARLKVYQYSLGKKENI